MRTNPAVSKSTNLRPRRNRVTAARPCLPPLQCPRRLLAGPPPTKTKQPELHRYWTQRDRAANVRLFHLAAEILHAIEMGVFVPNLGWQCRDCPFQSGAGRGSDLLPPRKDVDVIPSRVLSVGRAGASTSVQGVQEEAAQGSSPTDDEASVPWRQAAPSRSTMSRAIEVPEFGGSSYDL